MTVRESTVSWKRVRHGSIGGSEDSRVELIVYVSLQSEGLIQSRG